MIVFSSLQIRRGVRVLLDNATATINPGQKVGLVGKNGCGKSTLLSLLKNEISADGGSMTFPGNWQLAWVNQETPALPQPAIDYVIDGDREYRQLEADLNLANERNDGHAIATVHGKLDAIDAWTIRSRAASLLHGLGFSNEQLESPVSDFSGGWRMRLNLAQALICRSDLLLLDEPTNHLDLDAVIWLEKWLKGYTGTLILISHDRDFLDPIVDKIIHIEQQTMFEYTGNYSSFEVQRATRLSQQQSMYESQQLRVAHLQSYIDRFRAKATKAKQAQSRIKMLERMELIAPAHVDNPFHFSFRAPESLPNPLLKMEKVSAGYGERVILDSIKLNLVPGSRIGLLGRNGAGKSTLIKLLAGELQPLHGEIGLAKGIKLGYFAQHQLEFLRADESPLQHLARLAPQETEQKLRDYLGGFGFQSDKVNEETQRFSGGEKARLVLALIVWQRPNLLLLDEPTNHLDLDMRQALTEALIDFEGALVVVSHDRHLIRSTTDDLYLVHDGKVEQFDGDLEDYQQWLSDSQKQESSSSDVAKESGNSAQARKDQKRREAELRTLTQPLRKEITRLEKEMDKLNAQLAQAEEKLGDSGLYDASRKAELTTVCSNRPVPNPVWKSVKWPGWMHKSSWNRCCRKVKTGYDRAGGINAAALSYGNAPLYAPAINRNTHLRRGIAMVKKRLSPSHCFAP
jgi:ATP-binding cassette subfamily F protein 3